MHTSSFFRLALAAMLSLLAACDTDTPSSEPLPALSGGYSASSGVRVLFQPNGALIGPGGRGAYTVDGPVVRLTLSDGKQLMGRRENADLLIITAEAGASEELRLYREGSALAQSTEALTLPARNAPAAKQDVSSHADVPLEDYVALDADTTRAHVMDYLYAAFAQPAWTDEQKLERFSSDWRNARDAFARRDVGLRDLPHVNDNLAEYAKHRYYSVPLGADSGKSKALTTRPLIGSAIGSYDIDRKVFPLATCLGELNVFRPEDRTVSFYRATLSFEEPRESFCELPVPDETTARKVETALAASDQFAPSRVTVTGRLYFYVNRTSPPGNGVPVVHGDLTRAEITLHDRDTGETLATVVVPT